MLLFGPSGDVNSMRVQAPGEAAALWSFDLSPVTRRLERRLGKHAQPLETEFRRLAALWVAHPGTRLAPSRDVDEYWHEMILDTKLYRRFCAEVVGRQVDHIADDDATGMCAEYDNTRHLYQRMFGSPPASLWPADGTAASMASCGGGD